MAQASHTVNRTEGDKPLTQDGRRLRRRRIAAGLKIRDLHELSGVGLATISDLENGHYSARVTTLAKLAKALRCEIADLMADEDAAA